MRLAFLLQKATLAASLLPTTVAAHAADDPSTGFRLTATYDRPGISVPWWQFRIAPTGRVEYTSRHVDSQVGSPPGAPASPVLFTLSPAGSAALQKWIGESNGMQPCETKAKNLARMGTKTLEYQAGAKTAVQCAFNYTDNKPLASAADYLIAVSFTIEQGASLERLHRYDRLGLDPVMTQLTVAAKEGRAQELQAIRPTLQSLVQDEQVLERVRTKAAALLEKAGTN